ncbi:unnamed protein product, partial [Aureobasidium vineae]
MQLKGLHSRQSCPGGAYYICQNGFRGCCSIDPCNPGATCPDSSNTLSTSSATTRKPSPTSTSTTTSAPTPMSSPATMSSSSASTTSTSATPTATSLTCPAANMTTYIDPNKVQYSIRCNADNSYDSFNSTTVSTGGFGKCFSACDNFAACAGFTFVGTDSGICYLKSNLPADGYSSTAGSNYVTVALLDRNAQVVPPADALPTNLSDPSRGFKGIHIGAIVGGVVGGLALLILLALLVFFCLRSRRRKREERRDATQSLPRGPMEPHPKGDSLFAALGGFYQGHTTAPKQVPLDESQLTREDSVNGFLAPKYDKVAPTPATYNPTGPAEHSRHIMSWNNYDDRSVISPPSSMTMSPRIGSPDVSPMMNSSRDSTASKLPPERYQGHFI